MDLANDLLDVADSLAKANPGNQATYRRSVSTAYYAVFHLLVDAAAQRLVNAPGTPADLLFRRLPTHTQLKALCEELVPKKDQNNPVLGPKNWRVQAGLKGGVAPQITTLAERVLSLHSKREMADYDIGTPVSALEAEHQVDRAREVFAAVASGLPEPQWTLLLVSLLPSPKR